MKFKWTLLSICGALVSALLAYAFTRLIPSPDQGGLLIVCILAYMWAGFGFGRSFYSEALQKAGADSPLAEGRHPTWVLQTVGNRILILSGSLWGSCIGLLAAGAPGNDLIIPVLAIGVPLQMFCFDAIMYACVIKNVGKSGPSDTAAQAHYRVWAIILIGLMLIGELHPFGYSWPSIVCFGCSLCGLVGYLSYVYAIQVAADPSYKQVRPEEAVSAGPPMKTQSPIGIQDVGTLLVLSFGCALVLIPVAMFHAGFFMETIVGEVAINVLPVIAWCRIRRIRFGDVVPLAPVTFGTMAGAVLIALGVIPWFHLLNLITYSLWDPHLPVKSTDREMSHAAQLYPILAPMIVGLSAGFCEEIFWRGPMLKSLMSRLPRWSAILIAAFLFASWHLDIAGVLNRTLFGVLLGWLLIATGSVVPGMIIHGIYDAFLEGNRAWHIHALYVYDHFRIVHAPVYPWLISLLVGALLTYSGWMLCRSGFKQRQPIPVAEPEVAFIG